jgi:WD40 repeat protein
MTISCHWPWHNILLHWQVTGKQVGRLIFHRGTVRDCSWHPTQPMLVSSSWDGNLAKWEHLHGDKPQVSKLCSARFSQFEVDNQFDSEWHFFTFSFSHLCLSQAQCHILHVISWFLFMAIECLCELWPKIPKKRKCPLWKAKLLKFRTNREGLHETQDDDHTVGSYKLQTMNLVHNELGWVVVGCKLLKG